MKKIFIVLTIAAASFAQAFAQDVTDAQAAAEQAAAAIADAPKEEAEAPAPKYWSESVLTNISFTQLLLKNWAAGGFNAFTLAGNIDANANYAKDKMKWNNRLQLDYGFLYSQDKPILQKNKDRMYLESKWGYATPIRHLDYSANFSFLNQFDKNYTYGTPASDGVSEPTKADWLAARALKSGFLAPAYITLGLGVDWTPWDWLAVNFTPLTGGLVVVTVPELRKTYGMALVDGSTTDYKPLKFQFGAQLKVDAKWVINDNFSYTTQVVLFTDYLDKPFVKNRVTWDNKVFWKLAKFFALTLTTNMIYDPNVTIPDLGHDGIQFKEFLEFGFTYTIASK
jgi:hypothetical protein